MPKGREDVGAIHGRESPYLFGVFAGTRAPAQYGAADNAVSHTLQRYWTSFARTGDPNGTGLPAWPNFDSAARRHLAFTDSGAIARGALRREFCDVYIEHVTGPGRNQLGIWVGLRCRLNHGTAHPASLTPFTVLSQAAIWFQLTNVWLTTQADYTD